MSVQVNNTDNQLNIITNGVLDVYNVKTIKSVSRAVDASGNHYIALNFIANDKNNSVRIPLNLVTSPVGWTNDTAGAIAAVEDIRDWLSEVIDVDIDAANDSIGIYGYNGSTPTPVFVNANGQVAVQGLYGEDSAHSSTNSGMFVMGVRNDSNTSMTSANGDYSPIAVNANGAVAVNDGGNSITVDGAVELQFNDGLGPVNVNTTNPLPVTASVTFPSSFQSNTYDGAGTNAITSTSTGLITALDVNVVGLSRTPNILISSGDPATTITVPVYSITFFNNGSTLVNISIDGGTTTASIPAGISITMDAGGVQNTYPSNIFVIGSTIAVGASIIVTYNS
jgi:hypothetical protein